MFAHASGFLYAPEFPSGLSWMNHPPLFLKHLRGKVVLLHFWTETDISSLSVVSQLQVWHNQFSEKGFVIIGVHVPAFDFQKTIQHLNLRLKELGIVYPIIADTHHSVARLYANHWVPRMIVIDQQGRIAAEQIGTGGFREIEEEIQLLLDHKETPPLPLGFVHGRFGNAEDLLPREEQAFTDTVMHEEGFVYLHGHFVVTNDSVAHVRELPSAREYLRVVFRGDSVHLVARGMEHQEALIEVEFDGKPIPAAMRARDVEEQDGKTIVRLGEPRLYQIICSDTYLKGILTIKTASGALECFSLGFGGCKKRKKALG